MKKYYILFVTSSLLCTPAPAYKKIPLSSPETKKTIDDLYKDTNGYIISQSERDWITKQGGNATYGEITFEALQTILNDMNLTEKDVFVDLGCGTGKACFHVGLSTPARVKGYELSSTRIQQAHNAKLLYNKKNYIPLGSKVEFIEGDMKDARLLNATVVYMCSTCFSDELMKTMTNKLARKKAGLKIITLKKLPRHPKFKLIKTYMLPMTWSEETPVYVYQLQKK